MSGPTPAGGQGTADILEIERLSVRYNTRAVLSDLSLRLRTGDIFGLLGSNGAGKTTLVRAICGRVGTASGTIRIAGRSNRDRRALRRIGLVPQDIALYPHLTVQENLEVFASLSGVSAASVRGAVDWVIEVAHLGSRLGDRVEVLSGGWKRRVNIGAAMLHRPALLILDEPTVGVDIDARDQLHELIRTLSQGGMAVVLATHDMEQAEALCSLVGFLRAGRLDPIGPPQDLIAANFAGQRTVTLSLRGILTPEQRAAAAALGFSPDGSEQTWSAFGPFTAEDVTRLSARLREAGVEIREVRQREPGLDTLFAALAQTAPGRGAAA